MTYESLHDSLKDLIDPLKVGNNALPSTGMVMIVRDSDRNVLFSGSSNPDFDKDLVARVYSASKLVTPILVLQCVEDGLFGLDDPVSHFAPDWGYDMVLKGFDGNKPILETAREQLTWRHLCDHRAGLPYLRLTCQYKGRYHGIEPHRPEDNHFAAEHVKGPLDNFEPGTDAVYGTGLGAAGLIMKIVTGKDLEQLLQERICVPLGLDKTTFLWTEDERKLYAYREIDYDSSSSWHFRSVSTTSDGAMGDVTLVTNADEYSKIMGEVLRAVQGKDNKLFRTRGTGQQLLQTHYTSKARNSLNHFLRKNWEFRPWIDDLQPDDVSFGLGYLVNHRDLPNGRRAGSGTWEGLTGPTGIIAPADDLAITMFQLLYHVADPASRYAQDRLESELYDLHRD